MDEGYEVLEASSALGAIAVLGKAEKVDAVVTDIDMPGGLSGIDLAKAVAAFSPQTAILITSGGRDRLSVDDGSYAFLVKPYALRDVSDFLRARLADPLSAHETAKNHGLDLLAS